MQKELPDSAEGTENLDQTVSWSSSCGHSQSFAAIIGIIWTPNIRLWPLGIFFWHHNCQLLIRSQSKPGPELIRKICRSDYETGRWEALKLKPAQMESDACSANRRRPTAGCLKASDLWQLEWYGNCCLTGSKHTLLPARANRWIHTQVLDSSD